MSTLWVWFSWIAVEVIMAGTNKYVPETQLNAIIYHKPYYRLKGGCGGSVIRAIEIDILSPQILTLEPNQIFYIKLYEIYSSQRAQLFSSPHNSLGIFCEYSYKIRGSWDIATALWPGDINGILFLFPDHLVTLPVGRGHHDPSQKVSLGLVHDQDGWALKPIPSTYRLRYICERGEREVDHFDFGAYK